MTYTYEIAATTVETTDEPHTKTRVREVEEAFQDVLDWDVDLIGRMTPPAHIDGMLPNAGITLDMSDWADETVRNGFGFFSIKKELDDYFGESRGAANVVGQVLERDLTVKQVIAVLAENGDLQKAVNEIHNNRAASDPRTEVILAYTFVKYSLGWDAERILMESGDFKKGNTAQDQGGIDGWWMGERTQIKPGTEVASKGRGKLKAKDVPHAAYLWDCRGNLRVATMDGYPEMKDELKAETGVPKTLQDQSNDLAGNDMNRRFRYFWW